MECPIAYTKNDNGQCYEHAVKAKVEAFVAEQGSGIIVGVVVAIVLIGGIAAVWFCTRPKEHEDYEEAEEEHHEEEENEEEQEEGGERHRLVKRGRK